jgi:hypothetical protein
VVLSKVDTKSRRLSYCGGRAPSPKSLFYLLSKPLRRAQKRTKQDERRTGPVPLPSECTSVCLQQCQCLFYVSVALLAYSALLVMSSREGCFFTSSLSKLGSTPFPFGSTHLLWIYPFGTPPSSRVLQTFFRGQNSPCSPERRKKIFESILGS